jgi:hypothetical protein
LSLFSNVGWEVAGSEVFEIACRRIGRVGVGGAERAKSAGLKILGPVILGRLSPVELLLG